MASKKNFLLQMFGTMFGGASAADTERSVFAPAEVAAGTLPEGMAMDSVLEESGALSKAENLYGSNAEDTQRYRFIGYPRLASLQQDGIIQAMIGALCEGMTREWCTFNGDADAVKAVEGALKKHNLHTNLLWSVETCGYQGGCLLYIDMGVTDDREELATELTLDAAKIPQGSFKGFRQVEPFCVAPAPYQCVNPLLPDYFNPTHWYVHGQKVHRSRFLYFAWNTPPVLLRPAYNFFGIPLPQVVLPYLEDFTRSRKSASRLVDNFSLLGLKTDLSSLLNPDDGEDEEGNASSIEGLRARLMAFNGIRSNNGTAVIDKTDEEFFQINTPLSGVEGLVSQQLELISLVGREPVTELFGTPPRGFNATGDNENRSWCRRMEGVRSRLLVANFERARAIIELSELGGLQTGVETEWPSLQEKDEVQKSQARSAEAQTDTAYLDRGVLMPDEVRGKLAADPESGYPGLNLKRPLPKIDMAQVMPPMPMTAARSDPGKVESMVEEILAKARKTE